MKTVKVVIFSILSIIVALALAVVCLWGKVITTVNSVHQVGDNEYLYEMDYKASYNLDDLVEADIDSNSELLEYVLGKVSHGLYSPKSVKAGNTFSCTSFQAMKADGEGYYFGRNYDYYKNPTLVVHSHPKKGYASLSVCDMSHFGYGLDKLPEGFAGKALCIAGIYAPMDGINEKGVCISIMALPDQASRQDTPKHDVGTTIIMRLILDRCASVQEAIDMVNSVDVRHDAEAGAGYHYMVADAKGDAAVIEFDKDDEWKTMIVRKPADSLYFHVTNHLLDPKYYTEEPDQSVGNTHSRSWWRYSEVRNFLSSRGGKVTFDEAQECLSNVKWVELKWENGLTEDTQYSNVYDQTELTLALRPWNRYEETYRFSL